MNTTIVTGLWDINRHNRSFDTYIEAFAKVLAIPQRMYIYVPSYLEDFVWQYRDSSNTQVKICELEEIKRIYEPFWDKTQEIRTSEEWVKRAGWLEDSPQYRLEWYNPIVQSKMFLLHDATINDESNNDYYYWLDAGITNTVPDGHLRDDAVLDKLHNLTEASELLFLSFPYQADQEVHGFKYNAINKFARKKVEYVCRGGLFGGHSECIRQANGEYYNTLEATLNDGYMGTEESIFTIMSYIKPSTYRRYTLDENGLVVKFTEALRTDTAELEEIDKVRVIKSDILSKVKTNLYMLTFNMPEQLLHTIETMKKTDNLMTHPDMYLFDNSTDERLMIENRKIAQKYNMEYICLMGNTGICRARQTIAEHFHESDADYMIFFEDDMTFNSIDEDVKHCRSGFRSYIPNIYELIHKITDYEQLDFLKLSFTEVFGDNNTQWAWYNLPQHKREEYWPFYNELPIQGTDPNCPTTKFDTIDVIDEVAYAIGEVYYCNWPLLISKEGNKKMFIDVKFKNPFEQTQMSHIFQLTKEQKVRPAVLLASPIWHDRIEFYEPEERREN